MVKNINNSNNTDWKTIAIVVMAIAIVVLFYLVLSGSSPSLSPGQTEVFKSVVIRAGDPTYITSDGSAGKIETQNNDLILGTKRTMSDGVIHPIIFQQNGKEVARFDAKSVNVNGDLLLKGNKLTSVESYLLRAKVTYDSGDNRNEISIEKYTDTPNGWEYVCEGKIVNDDCDIGDISLIIKEIKYISGGDEYVVLKPMYGASLEPYYPRLIVYDKKGGMDSDTDGQFLASIPN